MAFSFLCSARAELLIVNDHLALLHCLSRDRTCKEISRGKTGLGSYLRRSPPHYVLDSEEYTPCAGMRFQGIQPRGLTRDLLKDLCTRRHCENYGLIAVYHNPLPALDERKKNNTFSCWQVLIKRGCFSYNGHEAFALVPPPSASCRHYSIVAIICQVLLDTFL